MANKIFINYRRDDDPGSTRLLHDRLLRAFSPDQLFIDVDDIPAGLDFVKVLEEAVAACDLMLVVIGPRWLEARDEETGARRIDNPEDYVRIEIEAALRRDIRVIPVLTERAVMPSAKQLPGDLKPLARRSAVRLGHLRFDADCAAMIKGIERAFAEEEPEKQRKREETSAITKAGPYVTSGIPQKEGEDDPVSDAEALVKSAISSTDQLAEPRIDERVRPGEVGSDEPGKDKPTNPSERQPAQPPDEGNSAARLRDGHALKWAAAAVVLLLLTGGGYYFGVMPDDNAAWEQAQCENPVGTREVAQQPIAELREGEYLEKSCEHLAFKREFRGEGRSAPKAITTTPDGGFVVVGQTSRKPENNTDMWVLRLDQNGKKAWSQAIGGNGDDWANGVALKPDGRIVVIGVSLSNSAGSEDVYVSQLTARGKIEWTKQFGGRAGEVADSLAVMSNGDIVVAFAVSSEGGAPYEFNTTVLHLSRNGQEKRKHILKIKEESDRNWQPKVAINQNDEVFVMGSRWNYGQPNNRESATWQTKIGARGKIWYHRTLPSDNLLSKGGPSGLLPTADGGLLALGDSQEDGAALVRFDSSGQMVWQKRIRNGLDESFQLKLLHSHFGPLILGLGSGKALVFAVRDDGSTHVVRRYATTDDVGFMTFSMLSGFATTWATTRAGEEGGRALIFEGRDQESFPPIYDGQELLDKTIVQRLAPKEPQ